MTESATCICAEGAPLPKPEALPVLFDNIPNELKAIPQWVCWKYEYRDGKKWTKPPCQTNGIHASSTDPQTWSTFEAVQAAYEKGGFDGVGIVLTEDMGIVGIDLDHMTSDEAQIYFDSVGDTYIEESPSGNGFRIFAKGVIKDEGHKKNNVEIYKSGRYLTITGHNLTDYGIMEQQIAIDAIYDYVTDQSTKNTTEGEREKEDTYNDEDTTKKFESILTNTTLGNAFYKSLDEADDRSKHEFSICCILYKHGFNKAQIMYIMDNKFPRSGSKWHTRDHKYKNTTIINAINNVKSQTDADGVVINISEVRGLNQQVNLALGAMRNYNAPNPTIFKQNLKLCTIIESSPGQFKIDGLSNGAIRHLLSSSATWVKSVKNGTATVYPPNPVVDAISGLHKWEGIPWLMGISNTPIVTQDGEIVTRTGFNEKTGFYYAPSPGFELPEIPSNPTQEDAIEAAEWLDRELFSDFPFIDEASRTNMLAALITSVARTMIDGCTPLMLIDKPTPGTGATKLVKLVSLVSTGTGAGLTKDPGTEEEWRKTVFTMLLECRPLLCFDNVDADLSSSSLSQMLTSDNVSERILGHSVQGSVPNRANWLATGNGVRVAGDMTRRVCLIQMDAKMAEPWTRTDFRHNDLEVWIKEHRSDILARIYTMIRAWCDAGKPALNTVTMGSFEAWAHIVGSVLKFAGRNDFMANALWINELNTMADEWAGFIAAFYEYFGERYVRASEIQRWIEGNRDIADVLPKEIADVIGTRGAVKAIGNRIGKKNHVRYKNGLMWNMEKDKVANAFTYAAVKPRNQAIV